AQDHNNFLAAIHFTDKLHGMAFLDISTGEFFVADGDDEYLETLLQSLKPAEVIFQRSFQKKFKELFGNRFYTYTLESWLFDEAYATENLLRQFQTHSLKGFGIDTGSPGIIAAGAILHYLRDTAHPNLQHLTSLQRLEREEFLWMDQFTIRNLELLPASNRHSLLETLDQTVSPMGARLLRRWMLFPLRDAARIQERIDAVGFLILQTDLRNLLQQSIKSCGDLERLAAKIPLKKINPREVLHLANALQQIGKIRQACGSLSDPLLRTLGLSLQECTEISAQILRELQDDPPVNVQKGGVIRSGVSAELDELRTIASGGKNYLVQLQQQEAEQTGISSLKIGFNNVFGYYLEVTHSHKNKVPADWIRKQTLANAERYITPELKDYEEKITGAEEKILALEAARYEALLQSLHTYIAPVQKNSQLLAAIDVLCSFSGVALQYGYHAPELHTGVALQLTDSRHPVIERHLPPGESYIPNDILLDPGSEQIIILTGPNMSGKSAILRQTALVTLMAHMGSFVPAAKALVPLTDKIFTRVGASDNLSAGESTFMVEMNETASILNNISARSLVLLDEIGRGTSTYDGISIAWSIVEYLHASPAAPKTLFATHYHELNDLEERLPRVYNYHVTNKEVGNRILFLRKLAKGGSTHSFGIHVARMAGMPASLIQRANEILTQLESSRRSAEAAAGQSDVQAISRTDTPHMQLSIFDAHSQTFSDIRKILQEMDINRLTPVEALMKLNEIKKMIQ
ncbi:MAG TPA: DNA mismatch repair protein MutS, partial [Sediminibacterium sp.]|nr:DNA mismatch repair protein MutS [Sediminibacterium sp.]